MRDLEARRKWAIREKLKENPLLVSVYQKIIGYNAGAKQWCRVVMDQSTEELITSLDYKNFSVLEVSGKKWKSFGFQGYTNKYFPEFDISVNRLEEKFDLIIAEQVFEHLKRPYKAAINIYEMLKPGGYFLITTPFLIKVHPSPEDCTRWSAAGLKFFLEECGFDIENIKTFSWGNRDCIVANFKDWIPFNASRHSLKNEADFPIVVWGLARKNLMQ